MMPMQYKISGMHPEMRMRPEVKYTASSLTKMSRGISVVRP
jgi:hypothetical protein